MALTSAAERELRETLEVLLQNEGELKDHERNFVSDQQERYDKYGAGILLSVKQWDWLRGLYKRVSGAAWSDSSDEEEEDAGSTKYDDEIPF